MLNELLRNEDIAAGFSLREDDHCVYVLRHGKQVAIFSKVMTKESLRALIDLIVATADNNTEKQER